MRLYCLKYGVLPRLRHTIHRAFMDGLENRRRRALYRANHRGTKELDLILGRYALERVPNMDAVRLREFEELLALPDPDIDRWIRGINAPAGVASSIADVRSFLGIGGKQRVPALSSKAAGE